MVIVTAVGRLGADPEAKQVGDKLICNLRVASKEFSGTEWVNVITFGKDSEFCQEYLKKGDSIAVTGRLQTRKWTDKNGAERYTTEIVASRVEGIGGKGNDLEEKPF